MGLEPTRANAHSILSAACLPIPSSRHLTKISIIFDISKFVLPVGLEPTNPNMGTRVKVWRICPFCQRRILLPRKGSNLESQHPKCRMLTNYTTGQYSCCLGGVRFPSLLVQSQTCYQLHYETISRNKVINQNITLLGE